MRQTIGWIFGILALAVLVGVALRHLDQRLRGPAEIRPMPDIRLEAEVLKNHPEMPTIKLTIHNFSKEAVPFSTGSCSLNPTKDQTGLRLRPGWRSDHIEMIGQLKAGEERTQILTVNEQWIVKNLGQYEFTASCHFDSRVSAQSKPFKVTFAAPWCK